LGNEGPPLLLEAARRLEPLNLDMARETYLTAWTAALFAGRLATHGNLHEVSRAARELPWSAQPGKAELILDALTLLVTGGPAAAAPALRRALAAFAETGTTLEEEIRWGWFAHAAALALWDHDTWRAILERQVRILSEAGALDRLPIMLASLGVATLWAGDFAATAAVIAESDTVCEATGTPAATFTTLAVMCLRANAAKALPLIRVTIAKATESGQGLTVAHANWVAAILFNGLGRYEEALAAAIQASENAPGLYVSLWALPELIEAAARTGNTGQAADAMARVAEVAQAGGTDAGLGLAARCRALLSEGQTADHLYREAIDRLSRTQLRPDLGRAHLLYGEWLRRENHRADARTQLRTAHDLLAPLHIEGFAERARRELQVTGERARRRTVETASILTPQEAFIARLARDGRTNPEIGAQLFLSVRTVEWHLRKIFVKLDVTSRRELSHALDNLPA
jgi:DNA-binding CsgD family transcriptional regulator